jgi:hypothetical protein
MNYFKDIAPGLFPGMQQPGKETDYERGYEKNQ